MPFSLLVIGKQFVTQGTGNYFSVMYIVDVPPQIPIVWVGVAAR